MKYVSVQYHNTSIYKYYNMAFPIMNHLNEIITYHMGIHQMGIFAALSKFLLSPSPHKDQTCQATCNINVFLVSLHSLYSPASHLTT